MVLTIDAGNTKTKWALFDDDGKICHQSACLIAHIATANLLPDSLTCDQIMISNVAGETHAKQLQQLINTYQATTVWITASKQAAHVINHYSTPELLGSDRWAALIAAWHMQHETCVVVNAGTATTIDAIVSTPIDGETFGVFIGGMILPGIDLMLQSLGTAAAQLPKTTTNTATHPQAIVSPFATTTSDAILGGAVNATLGAIKHMMQAIEQQYMQTPQLIISGGNAMLIQQSFTNENSADTAIEQTKKTVTIIDNLVLQGLYLLTEPAIKQTSQSTLS
jgi:type III pantothenate kinase